MGWFAGWFPAPGAPAPPDWPPLRGRPVWGGTRALSAMGTWAPSDLHTVEQRHGQLAVFGPCFASEQRSAEDFASALRHGDYEALTSWPGSYTLVVSDHDGIAVLTDLAGQYPVFATVAEHGVAYSSLARPLADWCGAAPDTDWLAAGLLCPGVAEATAGLSPYRGLRLLAGGQALRLTARGMKQWIFDLLPPDPTAHLDEAAEDLRVALTTAVRARMGVARRPTADLSGGLDSTSLALLAAVHASGPLPAFTYHNPLAPVGDDLAYAQRAVASEARLDHRILAGGAETMAYQGLVTAASSDEPDFGAPIAARTNARLRAVAAVGSDLHLTGNGGDVVLGAPIAYLADLARPGDFGMLLRHCAAWATLRHRSPATLAWAAWRLRRTARSGALRDLAACLVRAEVRPPGQFERCVAWWTPPGPETLWVTARARRQVAEGLMDQAVTTEPDADQGVGDQVALHDLRVYAAGHRLDREAAAALGVSLHAPYLDNQVVRACLRVPARLRGGPLAAKPLLGAALRGLVPESVLVRRTKGDYTGEEYKGLRRAIDVLRGLLADPLVADLGLVEPAPVRVALDHAVLGLPVPFAALRRVLGTELWLRDHAQRGFAPARRVMDGRGGACNPTRQT
ncbi:MAG: albusnodin/ikarugamycin family macrolactam cyclase [Egibacteraceae bacterium]